MVHSSSSGEEFYGPFPSWLDVRKNFGARGDGKTDDTAALQRALESPPHWTKRTPASPRILYLPAGEYRITRQLVMIGLENVALIGEHPERTIIRWDGEKGGSMIWANVRTSRFGRITWDGGGKAAAAFEYKWHDRKDPKQTSSHNVEHADEIFRDVGIGIDAGGKQGWLDSENLVLRCRFVRCSDYGITLRHFNAANWWIYDSEFTNCKVGVSNVAPPYGGTFHVFRSIFRNSTEADMTIFHAGFFSARSCVSVGSRRFFHAKNNGVNGAKIVLQGNTVIDSGEPDAVLLETLGPASLLDNTFASRSDLKTGPVMRLVPPAPGSLQTIGNTFTVEHAVEVKGQHFALDDRVVSRETLKPVVPKFPGFAPHSESRVVEVPVRANSEEIQQAIDSAAARARVLGSAIVHIPTGDYSINRTLTVPAGLSICLVGDGYDTVLRWNGRNYVGPVLRLRGPSRAIVRDLTVRGPRPVRQVQFPPLIDHAIEVDNADQPGGQISLWLARAFGEEVGLLVDGLDESAVQAIGFEGGPFLNNPDPRRQDVKPPAPYPAVRVIGGPKFRASKASSYVVINGNNAGRYDVAEGGRLVVRDSWYEHNSYPTYAVLRGTGDLTLDCGRIARPHPKTVGPALILDGFHGRLTLLDYYGPDDAKKFLLSFRGDCSGARVLVLGYDGREPDYLPSPTTFQGARVEWINCQAHAKLLNNYGGIDPAFVREMLALDRMALPGPVAEVPDGATNVQIRRVTTEAARVGIHVKTGH